MKVTMMGFLRVNPNGLEDSINFDFLSSKENETLRNRFTQKNYERPLLITSPDYFFSFLSNTVNILYNDVKSLYEMYKIEYNPLENYDRIEESHNSSMEHTENNLFSKQRDSTENNSNISSYGSDFNNVTTNDTNSVSAFDTSVLREHDKKDGKESSESKSSSNSSNDSSSLSNINSLSDTMSDSERMGSERKRIHGNIGVTTTSAMKKEFIETTLQFNFYEIVTDLITQKSECFYYFFN